VSDLGRVRRKKSKAGAGEATTARPSLEPATRSDDDFLTRIQLAMDMTPAQMAAALDLSLQEVIDRQGRRVDMSSFTVDPFWLKLQGYINGRLAGLIALKDELDRKERLDILERREREKAIRDG
jgi:hypothetical protein